MITQMRLTICIGKYADFKHWRIYRSRVWRHMVRAEHKHVTGV